MWLHFWCASRIDFPRVYLFSKLHSDSTIILSAFLGNSLGGLSVQKIGFEWTATLAAALQLPFVRKIFWGKAIYLKIQILGLICYKACVTIQKQYYSRKEAEPLAESRQSADDAETIVEFQRVSAI